MFCAADNLEARAAALDKSLVFASGLADKMIAERDKLQELAHRQERKIAALESDKAKLVKALTELAPCDFDHGWEEDNHSATCRKCAALESTKRP
jgi:hypothetical protein